MASRFRPGDRVIYRKSKHSTSPGPRAADVQPAPRGEYYAYNVDKFWTVSEVKPDGTIVVRTRRGKEHLLEPDDRALRKARWWERLLYRDRFPPLE